MISENPDTAVDNCLRFKPFELESYNEVRPFLAMAKSNTCDLTVAVIYMWGDYFHYTYCIYRDTLFIKGYFDENPEQPVFAVPLGQLHLSDAVGLIREYCNAIGVPTCFMSVPEVYLPDFEALSPQSITEIDGWYDYLYSAQELSTFSGKRFAKKRNHVNKFMHLYPDATVESITEENIAEVRRFYELMSSRVKLSTLAQKEYEKVGLVLDNYFRFEFISTLLRVGGEIVAFAIGEIVGVTLHADIEKTNHEYEGAAEYLNYQYINHALRISPDLQYENRQDDAGDPGLRQSKLSYNPIALLKKYSIRF